MGGGSYDDGVIDRGFGIGGGGDEMDLQQYARASVGRWGSGGDRRVEGGEEEGKRGGGDFYWKVRGVAGSRMKKGWVGWDEAYDGRVTGRDSAMA